MTNADSDLAADVRRGLIAGRDFLNRLPLNDGASRTAIDREYVAVKLIPNGLLALDALVAQVDTLTRERDTLDARVAALHAANELLNRDRETMIQRSADWRVRGEAAEARCARLQQALAHIESLWIDSDRRPPAWVNVAREALAGLDTPPVDELQRRTDEIYAADKAQDYNHMRGDS